MQNVNYNNPPDDFVKSIDIHSLLPQQEPFVMIGALAHFDLKDVATETHILPSNLFVENGQMSAAGLIENIAQTCAARIGYINKYILKKGIQLGFIGAIRNMNISELPAVGSKINTRVQVVEEVFGMLLATATITCDQKTIATTEIKIAVKES